MKLKLLFIVFCVALQARAQHNSTYSQYMFNGLIINPAYAGSNDALNLTALYRKQWLGLDGSPTTITFSAHAPLRNRKVNLGLVVMDDKFGISEHTKAAAVYAYRVKLYKGQFSLGMQGGVDVYQANWSQVRTTQLRDPSFSINTEKKILPLLGFGMYYYTQRFYLGVSAPSLFNKGQLPYETAIVTSGVVINVSEDIKIKPAVLVRYLLNSPLDANISSTFYWKNVIGIGLGYSRNGTATAFMDLRVNEQFRIGYAYDYTFSKLRDYSTGSHEVMLRYLFNYKVSVPSTRYF